jgi:integrase
LKPFEKGKIARIKNLLLGQRRFRDLLLFVVDINSALRISDLLQLKVGHFIENLGRIRGRFWIKAQNRTGKSAMEVRDHLAKFSNNDDGIFMVKSAGEVLWQVEGGGWG